jgi:hypothetical protein
LASVPLLGACGDDVTDPAALLDAEEAEAVLRSAETLPLLPRLMDDIDARGDHERAVLVRARELWDAGSTGDLRSPIRRRLAVGYALPVLLQETPAGVWPDARARVDDWVGKVNVMLQHLDLPDVESSLRAAERNLARSDRATSERNRVYYLLLAGSELVETTPRWVARTLAEESEAAVRQAQERGALSEQAMDRAVRLKNWSATAVQEGDYLRAIQRAYYALQLVEGQ